jgi:hypothetical protein
MIEGNLKLMAGVARRQNKHEGFWGASELQSKVKLFNAKKYMGVKRYEKQLLHILSH